MCGSISVVSIARVSSVHLNRMTDVLEDEVARAAVVQRPHPVHCACHRIYECNAWCLTPDQELAHSDVVSPDPQRVDCLLRPEGTKRAVRLLREVRWELGLEYGEEGARGEGVRARRTGLGVWEEAEVSVLGRVDRPYDTAVCMAILVDCG